MNPKPSANDGDRTAVSSPGHEPAHGLEEVTDTNTATDATLVRSTTASVPLAPPGVAKEQPSTCGKYELLGEIARGGMGVVYRARQHGLDRLVALKMILGTGTDHESAQRFLQEARAAAALDHPNVVPIYDIGEDNGRPYFTMALIDGPNLRGFVDTHGSQGPLPVATAVSLFAQIVAGVAHAHKHGIIHRDLKPANVLIDKDGRPRVTDFGLAKRAAVDSALTATGQVVGTPQYMAPEQARDSKDVGTPADVYALGAILHFLLTGKPPFTGESFTDLLLKVMTEPPVPLRQARADVPAELDALCLRCLAKAPGDRPADALALAAELAPIADQFVTPSASLRPSVARIGMPQPRQPIPQGPTEPDLSTPSATGTTTNSVTAVAAPAAVPNRTPIYVGAGVLIAVLVGVIAFLATRDDKKDEGTKHEPPELVKGPSVKFDPPTGPAPPPDTKDKHAWPAPARADFGLKVDLVAPAAKKDADGTIRMTAGTPMSVHLRADKDCRVSVWFLDPAGHATRLFPNDDEPDDRLVAGKERVIPGNNKYTLETTVTEGAGLDRLRVIATTGEPPAFPGGTKVGRFSVFSGEDGERVVSIVRGVVLKKTGTPAPGTPDVSEAELKFRVQK
jgi:eukaryotic-like serine/threonine-protein kinase